MRLEYCKQPVVIKDGDKYIIEMHYLWLKWQFGGLSRYCLYPANDCFLTKNQIDEIKDDSIETWNQIGEHIASLIWADVKVKSGIVPAKDWRYSMENHIIIFRNLVEIHVRENIREAIRGHNLKYPEKGLSTLMENFFTYGANLSNGTVLNVARRGLLSQMNRIQLDKQGKIPEGSSICVLTCSIQIDPTKHKLSDIFPRLDWVDQELTQNEIDLAKFCYSPIIDRN